MNRDWSFKELERLHMACAEVIPGFEIWVDQEGDLIASAGNRALTDDEYQTVLRAIELISPGQLDEADRVHQTYEGRAVRLL